MKNKTWNCNGCKPGCSIATNMNPNEFLGECEFSDKWVLEKPLGEIKKKPVKYCGICNVSSDCKNDIRDGKGCRGFEQKSEPQTKKFKLVIPDKIDKKILKY